MASRQHRTAHVFNAPRRGPISGMSRLIQEVMDRGSLQLMMLGLLSLIAIATPVPVRGSEAMSVREWEALWARVLSRHVDEQGRIDFAAVKRNHSDLDRVVAFVAAVDPASQPQRFSEKRARLAFYINAYNALAMHGVVDAGIPESLGGLAKMTFFYMRTFTVGGKSMSLHAFENEVIRPLGEERVHFALNCMTVGCPRLPRAAFTADAIERQLQAAARAFVAEPRNVRVEPGRREVWLSAIFDFYTKDFVGRAPNLIAYVNRHRTEPIPEDFRVRFLDYDWTVNDRRLLGRREVP